MRNEKVLLNLLKGLVSVVQEEAEKNPEFANRLDQLMATVPSKEASGKRFRQAVTVVPDVYSEFASRGENDFKAWLTSQRLDTLKAIVRKHDFDATRRTSKLKDTTKLVELITSQIRARSARGSGFLSDPAEE